MQRGGLRCSRLGLILPSSFHPLLPSIFYPGQPLLSFQDQVSSLFSPFSSPEYRPEAPVHPYRSACSSCPAPGQGFSGQSGFQERSRTVRSQAVTLKDAVLGTTYDRKVDVTDLCFLCKKHQASRQVCVSLSPADTPAVLAFSRLVELEHVPKPRDSQDP